MLFVGTSIIHPSTEGVFLLCNILDLLIYSSKLEEIKGISIYNSISDIYDKLGEIEEKMEDIQGDEFRKSSMAELSKKLDDVVWEISNINS